MSLSLPPIILASASPRRRDLLSNLGLTFEVIPADVDESFSTEDVPYNLAERLSAAKAERVAADHPEALVIAADTIVVYRERVLGKPTTPEANLAYLELLSGHTHEVYTGHTLRLGDKTVARVSRTAVRFRKLSPEALARYVATGEGMDKAGGYAIQGYGSALVGEVRGCYFNVVGLSVPTVVELAQDLGLELV